MRMDEKIWLIIGDFLLLIIFLRLCDIFKILKHIKLYMIRQGEIKEKKEIKE